MSDEFVNIRVEGDKELRRLMRRVGNEEAKKALARGHRDIAREVAEEAAREAPVRSGTLQRSVRGLGSQASARIKAGKAGVPYAGPIHYGWPARNIKPNEFIHRALANKLGEAREGLERLYDRIARQLASGMK